MTSENRTNILKVENLKMHFPARKSLFKKQSGCVRAVDDVSFSIGTGETLGLVGESGCGKTTIGRCIMRVYAPTAGSMHYVDGEGETVDLSTLGEKSLKPYRKQLRMIFQDPYSSLNPRMSVFRIIAEPLIIHGTKGGSELKDRVEDLLKKVGLRPEYMRRYPHAFSGGQRQRICIARALALDPRVVVCDEAVSALDVSVQAQILNLLKDLQSEFGLTYLFISHDLSVVEYLCDRVAVMYVGKLVELASRERLFASPLHPYTQALLSAVPKLDPRKKSERIVLEGDVADPSSPPPGCYFHPRCRYAREVCRTEYPALREVSDRHFAACHLASIHAPPPFSPDRYSVGEQPIFRLKTVVK